MGTTKQIQVKILRAEKRGRKTIIVFESDLYSNETFALNPFYSDGDDKNQLQHINFSLRVEEKAGKVSASVGFNDGTYHSTKGFRQIHQPIGSFFLDKKDCALDWVNNEKEEFFTPERIKQVLDMWNSEPEFRIHLEDNVNQRIDKAKKDAILKAKDKFAKAAKRLEELLTE